jgi:hypothetical protein
MLHYIFLPVLCLGVSVLPAQGRCQRGNCENGEGTLRFADGALYTGAFRDGQFHGQGSLLYADGSTYTGYFRNQRPNGIGTLIDPKGNRYTGMWQDGKREGKGELHYADGSRVAGRWVADRLEGDVKLLYANADHYAGQMHHDRIEGYGTMSYANGDRYTGEWQNNQRHGSGTMRYLNGVELQGNWRNDRLSVDWDRLGYTGPKETLLSCNEGCPDGDHRFTYYDGTVYYGQMVNGTPRGRGTVDFADGRTYTGYFEDHRPHGIGLMTYPDGRRSGGIWNAGTLYESMHEQAGEVVAAKSYDPEVRVWAVVVGCAQYQHMKTLRYTDDDAYKFYAFLKSIEGGALDDRQVKVLVDESATEANILATMRETYRQADENDVILFYFSGHGLPGSFLPTDYDGADNALAHQDVRQVLDESRSRHKLVIADACHSGSLAARSGRSNEATLAAYYGALTDATSSTALLMSSKEEEISLEDGGLRSGVFSHYLIRGMKGEADRNHDLLISIPELFQYVYTGVREYTGNVQTPTLTGTYDAELPIASVRAR